VRSLALAILLLASPALLGGCTEQDTAPQRAAGARHAPTPPANRLGDETSAYLRDHAAQPVHWRTWRHQPLQEAERLSRPVMLVLGFGACQGCHVLARGPFSDPEFAEYVNERFIPVLVDRDERPDLDAVYMIAVRLLTGGAGWPAVVFLDSSGAPFQAYTYGAAASGERRDLRDVVEGVANDVEMGMDVVSMRAYDINDRLRVYSQPRPAGDVPETGKVFGPLMLYLAHSYDRETGGFGDSPRFVRPPALDFLLRLHRRTGQTVAREMVETTLLHARQSPLHDPVDGGFHRYARGPAWRNPAYEKTLADNAAIAAAYMDAWQTSGRDELAQTARTTLDFMVRRLSSPSGALYASLDSESAGADGKPCTGCYYELSDDQRSAALASTEARERLRRERETRHVPRRNEALLADANGLAIGALARGAMLFGDGELHARAVAAADAVLKRHRRTPVPSASVAATATLVHCIYEDGAACGNADAYLDDYVFLSAGLLDLFEADPDPRWLQAARELADEMIARFEHAGTGGFFLTAADAEPLLFRPKPDSDTALPSGNSAAVVLLMRLYAFTDAQVYREAAERTLRAFSHVLEFRPLTAPALAAGLDAYDDPFKNVVLVVPEGAEAEPLRRVLARTYLPNRAIIVADGKPPPLPVAAQKVANAGRATAYVCESHVCRPGTDDPRQLAAALASVVPPDMD